jgi:hypothetical protein
MRSESLLFGAATILGVGLILSRRRHGPPPLLGELTQRIVVNVRSTGDDLEIDVTPNCAEIEEGQQVDWTHNVDQLQVVPKGQWPYTSAPPAAGKGKPVRSGPMKGKPTLNRAFGYTLVMTVAGTGNPQQQRRITLDPDIIIREPGPKYY